MTFEVESVYKDGELVAQDGELLVDAPSAVFSGVTGTVHIGDISVQDLRIPGKAGQVEVVGIEPGRSPRSRLREEAPIVDGAIVADPARDLLKLVVIERHHASGSVGLGLVKGFGLRKGAIASSVAHDAHNLVIAGASDGDILMAARALEEMGGGFVCVVDGEVQASVPLPLGGLVSPLPVAELVQQLRKLDAAAAELGCYAGTSLHDAQLSFSFGHPLAETDRSGID